MLNQWDTGDRLGGLSRSASFATLFVVLGHLVLGFEQSIAQVFVALGTAYVVELGTEWIDSRANGRPVCFLGGGPRKLAEFLMAGHMTALSISMLIYPGDRLWVMAFAVAVALGQKRIFRAPVNGKSRHFLNPSNAGIVTTLLLFHWVGNIPYEFTAGITGPADWIVPAVIMVAGTLLNARFTGRLPLIVAWIGAFAMQATLRSVFFGTSVLAGLMPMTGTAFILYTFYMMTDPATTPSSAKGQVTFAAVTAAVYGILMAMHVPFALFFGLTLVGVGRGIMLHVAAMSAEAQLKEAPLVISDMKGR